jgi:hypothetical protein
MSKSIEIQSTREKKMLWNNPIIDEKISSCKTDELQLLHQLIYDVPGKSSWIRRNIRRFEGFKFNASSVEYQNKLGLLRDADEEDLTTTCKILNINAEGEEFSEISRKIMDFLVTVQKERPTTSKRTEKALSVSHSSNLQSNSKSQHSKSSNNSQKSCQLRSDLKKQKELLELEERILKRKAAIQKIEDDLLEEESNMSEEVLEQFDADFPAKEKVQDWMKQNRNLDDYQER